MVTLAQKDIHARLSAALVAVKQTTRDSPHVHLERSKYVKVHPHTAECYAAGEEVKRLCVNCHETIFTMQKVEKARCRRKTKDSTKVGGV